MKDDASDQRRLQVVRLTLFMTAIGWGLSLIFLLAPWEEVIKKLILMGAKPMSYDPFLDHWMRQTAVTFTALGGLCLMAACRPRRYEVIIRPIAYFHLILGITAAISVGVKNLTPSSTPTLIAELAFSFGVGAAVLIFSKKSP